MRTQPGAADDILRTLESFGFEWDGSVEFQSHRTELYEAALARLREMPGVYACRCSRSDLATLTRDSQGEAVYPGRCRNDPGAGAGPHALRLAIPVSQPETGFQDLWQGPVRQDCAREVGDFIIRRRDQFFAYHLAVVVDDADQGMTEVIRGRDLLDCTPRQILLQQALGLPTPRYGHLPILLEQAGTKLSKSRRALPVDSATAGATLSACLQWLGQSPPAGLSAASPQEVLRWGLVHWRPDALKGLAEHRLPPPGVGIPGK